LALRPTFSSGLPLSAIISIPHDSKFFNPEEGEINAGKKMDICDVSIFLRFIFG